MNKNLFSIATTLTFLVGCPAPEVDVNKDLIFGTVIVPPASHDEVSDATNNLTPESIKMAPWGNTIVSGKLAAWGQDEDGTFLGDVDTYSFVAERDVSLVVTATMMNATSDTIFHLSVEDLSLESDSTATFPGTTGTTETGTTSTTTTGTSTSTTTTSTTETGTTSTTTTGTTTSTTTTSTTETAETGTTETAETGTTETAETGAIKSTKFAPMSLEPVVSTNGLNDASLTINFLAGHTYKVTVAGVQGSAPVNYQVALPAGHPDDAQLLVGAYAESKGGGQPDIMLRGAPIGGASVSGFVLQDDWSYIADYQLYTLQSTTSSPAGIDIVSDISRAWLFAGNWSSLNEALPEQTFYTTTPVMVETALSVSCPENVEIPVGVSKCVMAGDLVVDAIALPFEGMDINEQEPNHPKAQDLGELSGNGYMDTIRGEIDIQEGEWIDDWDTFAFTVPEPSVLTIGLAWESCENTNLDVDIGIGDFEIIGFSWDDCPEQIVTPVLDPSVNYTVRVYAWDGDGPTDYTLTLEQDAPK